MAPDVGSLTFVADAIIAHLRSGHRPIDEEAAALTRLPIIADLRVRLQADDEGWLVELMKVRGNHGILGAGLIKKESAKKPNVQDLLRARFDEATGPDGSIRAWLFWKILDDHHLTADWHERLFRYAMDDWAEFKGPSSKSLLSCGGCSTIRLEQNSRPYFTPKVKPMGMAMLSSRRFG